MEVGDVLDTVIVLMVNREEREDNFARWTYQVEYGLVRAYMPCLLIEVLRVMKL